MHKTCALVVIAAIFTVLCACSNAAIQQLPVQQAPVPEPTPLPASPPEPPPTPPPQAPVPEPVPSPVPAPQGDPLAGWFNGGFPGKTVVVWGNSTVSNASSFFFLLRYETTMGLPLEGLDPSRILNYGNNGASLAALLAGQGPYPISAVINAQPDLLIIRGPLINDVRLGATTLERAVALLGTALEQIRAGSPRTSILLTTENSLLSSDPAGLGLVQPSSRAQQYTDILRAAVLAFDGKYPNVKVYDVMAAIYGIVTPETSPMMLDQLHPSQAGQEAEARLLARIIGRQ